jgi:hypothetical protein
MFHSRHRCVRQAVAVVAANGGASEIVTIGAVLVGVHVAGLGCVESSCQNPASAMKPFEVTLVAHRN